MFAVFSIFVNILLNKKLKTSINSTWGLGAQLSAANEAQYMP